MVVLFVGDDRLTTKGGMMENQQNSSAIVTKAPVKRRFLIAAWLIRAATCIIAVISWAYFMDSYLLIFIVALFSLSAVDMLTATTAYNRGVRLDATKALFANFITALLSFVVLYAIVIFVSATCKSYDYNILGEQPLSGWSCGLFAVSLVYVFMAIGGLSIVMTPVTIVVFRFTDKNA